MTPERWQRLSAIYHAALTRTPDARVPLVHDACGDDDALRQDVLSLLRQPSGEGVPGLSGMAVDSEPGMDAVRDDQSSVADLAGRQIGPYRIVELLGVGGMGHVYRARDTTLDREVAIKMLPRSVAADPDRLARFDREARVLAALNHPHIGAIYGFVDVDGARALVLELVDGETLAERLRRGPLPFAETIAFGDQIAQALDAAHQAGIVHRDLKPANIKTRRDGTLKVLDFGLAKVMASATTSEVPTGQAYLSTEGLVVGTPAYMSPEQARGLDVDRRTDVWAFGCVLFEMLTGRAAFGRATSSDTIAAILDHEPDWSLLPATTSAAIKRLLRRCLDKAPQDRLRDIGDARADLLEHAADGDSGLAQPIRVDPRVGWRLMTALAAALGAAGIIAGWQLWRQPSPSSTAQNGPQVPRPPTSLTRATFDEAYVEGPAISPDGTLIAFASDRGGADNLDIWVQHVAGGDPIRVTTGAADDRQPTFSPDGGQILYRSEGDGGGLFTVPTLGGVPRLVSRPGVRARSSPDGTRVAYWTGSEIGFRAQAAAYQTFVLPIGGGAPAEIRGFTGARFPVWSPDGGYLVVAGSRAATPDQPSYDWHVVRLSDQQVFDTGAREALRTAGAVPLDGLVPAPYAWIGNRLLTSAGGGLWSVRIDATTLAVGDIERLTLGPGEASEPSVSRDGLVAFIGSSSSQGLWALPLDAETVAIRGEPTALTAGAGPFGRGSFSADGRRLAYQATRAGVAILVQDTTTGRATDLGVAARNYGPVLSPDGSNVAFPTADGGVSIVPSGGGAVRRVCDDCEPGGWTSDGRRVTWSDLRSGLIHVLDLATGASAVALEPGGGAVNRAHISPDDRWLAFRAFDAEQAQQVFVARMTSGTPVPRNEWVSISDEFERDARPTAWSPLGRMVYFLSSRDGFRCLYARPWDPTRGQPRGPVQLVRHFHNLRNPGGGGASVISTGAGDAISLNRFVYDYEVTRGDVWTLRLPVAPDR